MIRRTFLRLLGLAPAIPLAAKLPALAAPAAGMIFVDSSDIEWKYVVSDGYFGSSPHRYQVWNIGTQLPRNIRYVSAEFDDALAKIERANPGGLERAFKSAFRRP